MVWHRTERAIDELRRTTARVDERWHLGVKLDIRSGPLFGGSHADQKRASLLGWHRNSKLKPESERILIAKTRRCWMYREAFKSEREGERICRLCKGRKLWSDSATSTAKFEVRDRRQIKPNRI